MGSRRSRVPGERGADVEREWPASRQTGLASHNGAGAPPPRHREAHWAHRDFDDTAEIASATRTVP